MVVNITSVNVRGLRDENKRRAIFNRYRPMCHILCLQETHSTEAEVQQWTSEWGGTAIFAHGTNRSRGVAVLIKKGYSCDISQICADTSGRYIMCNILVENCYFALVCIYGPNEDKPEFFTSVFERCHEYAANKILIGDFNTALNISVDRKGDVSTSACDSKSAIQINALMEQYYMCDLWRVRNYGVRRYSWFKPNNIKQASRIDYAIISEGIVQQIYDLFYHSNIYSDHSAMSVIFQPTQSERGPSYWKLNTTLLLDGDYLEQIRTHIADKMVSDKHLHPKTRWENLKESIKQESIKFSKKKACEKRIRRADLSLQISDMEETFDTISYEDFQDLQAKRVELESLTEEHIKGVIFRSRCRWYEEGEKNNKYFFNLEQNKYNAKTCTALIDPKTDNLITEDSCILQLQQQFYQELYTADPNIMFDVKGSPPYCVSDEDRERQQEPLTLEEISEAVLSMKNNKCPGPDGLPVDIYRVFWAQVKHLLFDVINISFEEKNLHRSASRGILSLIPKGQKDTRYLKNMRPLTMLNTDYKIIEKSLVGRLMSALEVIINLDQKGFMPGRSILVNIRKMFDLIKIATKEDIPMTVLQIDIAKAFDKVEMTAIQGALSYFKFSDYLKEWFAILYKDFYVRVQNNGNLSKKIHVQRSVHQGAPASAALFLCVAEVLAIIVRNDCNVHGVCIDEIIHLLNQYADDTDVTTDEESMYHLTKDLDSFRRNTGCAVNYDKTTIYRVKSARRSVAKCYTDTAIDWCTEQDVINVLGINVCEDEDRAAVISHKKGKECSQILVNA